MAYKDVCRELKTNAMRKYERAHQQKVDKIITLNWEARRFRKPQAEQDITDKLYDSVMAFINSSHDVKKVPPPLSPTPNIEVDNTKWGEPILKRLIRERREMPKAERLEKYRNDSIDEVDTTDLENWAVKARRPLKKGEKDPKIAKSVRAGQKGSLEWLWAQ